MASSKSTRRAEMRTVATAVGCLALSIGYTIFPLGVWQQLQYGSVASAQVSPKESDELHFVSVLTLHGEVVAIDPANRLVTVRDANGHSSKLEVRSEKDLDSLKVGDRVVAHYVEGAQINKKLRGAARAASLNDGMTGSDFGGTASKGHMLVATVENVDAAEQEVTIKGEDGSLETIMVANPKYLRHIKVGDRVAITSAQALALSLEKAG
jgi:hypothetical protein